LSFTKRMESQPTDCPLTFVLSPIGGEDKGEGGKGCRHSITYAKLNTLHLAPIRNYQPPRRQERQDQKGSLGETNGTSEGPMSALSGSLVERSEHRILGDPGTQRQRWVIMAVQVFSRIRPSCTQGLPRLVGELNAFKAPAVTCCLLLQHASFVHEALGDGFFLLQPLHVLRPREEGGLESVVLQILLVLIALVNLLEKLHVAGLHFF